MDIEGLVRRKKEAAVRHKQLKSSKFLEVYKGWRNTLNKGVRKTVIAMQYHWQIR